MARSGITVRSCFINDKKELMSQYFAVEVPLDADVAILAKKIKDENPSQTANVDLSKLVMWKWSGGLNIVRREQLDNQLGYFEEREGVRRCATLELLKSLQWSNDEDLLVVQMPEHLAPDPASLPQSLSEPRPILKGKPIDGAMVYVYEYLWGKGDNLSKLRTQRSFHVPGLDDDDTVDDAMVVNDHYRTDAVFYNLSDIPSLPKKDASRVLQLQFYVRQEYHELDTFLEAQRHLDMASLEPPTPVLLTGQPGIGKSVYLTYCLVKRLVERKPTVIAVSRWKRYVFLEGGVYLTEGDDFEKWDNPEIVEADGESLDGLVLFDLNLTQGVSHIPNRWRVLVVSSPKPQETRSWIKVYNVSQFYMKTWSWEEIYVCRKLDSVEKQFNDNDWLAAFLKYGGSARHLFCLTEKRLERDLDEAIMHCDPSDIVELKLSNNPHSYSHRLLEINPQIDQNGTIIRFAAHTRIISHFVFSELMKKKERFVIDAVEARIRGYLNGTDEMKDTAGYLFEGVGHDYILRKARSAVLPVRQLEGRSRKRKRGAMGRDAVLNLQHLDKDMEWFVGVNSPFAHQSGTHPTATKYYRPFARNLPGIDSFAFERDCNGSITSVVLFQYTVSRYHPVNMSFVEKLWDALPEPEKYVWKLVFVFLGEGDDVTIWRKMPISTKTKTLEKKISQFLLEVDLDDMCSTIHK